MKKFPVYALALAPIASGVGAADMDAPIIGDRIAEPIYVGQYASPGGAGRVTGNLEGSFNKGKTDLFDLDNRTWALRGAMNYDAGSGFNVQGDVEYGRTDVEDFDFDRLAGTAHVYHRPTQDYAIGAFGQVTRFGTDFFDNMGVTGLDTDITDKMAGIEGAWFNDLATAYIQLGYGQASWAGEDADHLMGRLGFRYFITDNIRFDIEGALHRFSHAETDADLDVRTLKTVANYRPDGTPVSLFAGYRYDEWEPSVSGISRGTEKNHSIFAGLRYHFGSVSLKAEERSGPIWTSTPLLP